MVCRREGVAPAGDTPSDAAGTAPVAVSSSRATKAAGVIQFRPPCERPCSQAFRNWERATRVSVRLENSSTLEQLVAEPDTRSSQRSRSPRDWPSGWRACVRMPWISLATNSGPLSLRRRGSGGLGKASNGGRNHGLAEALGFVRGWSSLGLGRLVGVVRRFPPASSVHSCRSGVPLNSQRGSSTSGPKWLNGGTPDR